MNGMRAYGRWQAIARAIRAEISGGGELLEAEAEAYREAERRGWWMRGNPPVTDEFVPSIAALHYELARTKRVLAESAVRRRYGVPVHTSSL
jgi:hypothetical protein